MVLLLLLALWLNASRADDTPSLAGPLLATDGEPAGAELELAVQAGTPAAALLQKGVKVAASRDRLFKAAFGSLEDCSETCERAAGCEIFSFEPAGGIGVPPADPQPRQQQTFQHP